MREKITFDHHAARAWLYFATRLFIVLLIETASVPSSLQGMMRAGRLSSAARLQPSVGWATRESFVTSYDLFHCMNMKLPLQLP